MKTFRYVLWDDMPRYEQLGWSFAYYVSEWACAMEWLCNCKRAEPV